jgi:phage major head subunit gpT-like protein
MTINYQLLPREARVALEEFSQEFSMALVQAPVVQWASELGLYKQSSAPRTTYPVPLSAAGYREFLGDMKYRDLFAKSLTLIPRTFQDGVSMLSSIIESTDFLGWDAQPAAIASAADSLRNELIAAELAANAVSPIDGLSFFNDAHLNNPLDGSAGTFDNLRAGAGTYPTVANLQAAKQSFRQLKGPNGKPLGLRMTHVLAPASQEEAWRDLLERDLIIESKGANNFGAVDNRHKGTVTLVIGDELTSDSFWYPLALNKPGMMPWIVQDNGAPEQILHDKTSHMYKTTLKVGIAFVKTAVGGLALPQCVQRWDGTP